MWGPSVYLFLSPPTTPVAGKNIDLHEQGFLSKSLHCNSVSFCPKGTPKMKMGRVQRLPQVHSRQF